VSDEMVSDETTMKELKKRDLEILTISEKKSLEKKGKPRIFDLGTKRWRLEC